MTRPTKAQIDLFTESPPPPETLALWSELTDGKFTANVLEAITDDTIAIWAEDEERNVMATVFAIPQSNEHGFIGHAIHLASRWRNRKLLRFSEAVLDLMIEMEEFQNIGAETQNHPALRSSGKLADYLGFTPFEIEHEGRRWIDWVFFTKN